MKEQNKCKIVQDLLPNYIEKLTKVETNIFIEDHIKECDECKNILGNMQKEFQLNTIKRDNREVKYIKRFSSKLKILKVTILIILSIALAIMTYYYFYMREAYISAAELMVEMVKEGMYPETFYATIEEIYDSGVYGIKSVKVKGLDINDVNHRGEFYFDIPLENIGDNFKIKYNRKDIPLEQLKIGQKVAIYNYGDINEQEPNCLTSVRMIVALEEKSIQRVLSFLKKADIIILGRY